jgi:predicted molibdopterin-dependent oxidoreductase YjgC
VKTLSKSPAITLMIDGLSREVMEGATVAAAISADSRNYCRTSVGGQHRAPFCGMGICQECRVVVDGRRKLACQTLCRPGMIVERIK